MCYATPVQPKIGTDKIIQRYTHSTWFLYALRKWCQRLYNLKSLRRYHCTLHSHNLTFTTSVKFDFRILHLHNLKSLSTIWLYTTLAQPDFHYICTTWFQGSTLAQPEIFISMVKWNISRCTRNPNFHYIRKKWFLWPFSFLLCVCFLTCTVHISYLYLCLN